jgi:hypothetical protein
MAKQDFQIDEEQIRDQLEAVIREIHENEDPAELDEYRRMFKKYVSIFKRGYAAAYMLKYFKGERRPAPRRRQRSEAPATGDMVSVFIGIGRTRRVYPRDLVGLILDNTTLAREDVGNIKILDNYSFADIKGDKADEVIQALNESEFRGRTLNVNYAKKKN